MHDDHLQRQGRARVVCAWRWFLAAAVALLAVACGKQDPSDTAAARLAPAVPTAAVVTVVAKAQPLGTTVEAVGTARANESVTVTSKSSNLITAISFDEGQLVRRGQILVQLDDAEARAALAEAEAALLDSENQHKRSRSLVSQQALSVSQMEQVEAVLKASRARVDAARARLADTTIRAGFDGRTGLRQVSIGSLVSPGTAITTLDDATLIKLEFRVPETHLHLLRRGQAVTATAAGLPGRKFAGILATLDSRVDPVTRSIAVRAEISNHDGALRPGMFMTVVLQGDTVPAVILPEGSIVPEQGHAYVFVVANGVAVRREVHVGRRRAGEVEAVDGLAEGERVVVEGTQNLRDGMVVQESDDLAPPALGAGT